MRLVVTGLLMAAALLQGCGAKNVGPATTEDLATPVRIAPVEHVSATREIRAVGILAPRDEVRLSFKVGGVIESLSVHAGDRVEAGQVLAVLKRTEVEAAVAQAREAVAKAQRDLERARRLQADEVATQEQVEDLTTAYNVAQSNLRTARFNAEFSRIVAPADGVVLQRLAEADELVQGGQPVLVLGATGEGWVVRVGLADRDLVRVELGDAARVEFDAFPDRVFEGRVSRIASSADPQTGTFEVEIEVEAQGMRFARGLVAKASLALETPGDGGEQAAVPITAIVEANGPDATVYLLDEPAGVVRRRQIVVGDIVGERVIVVAGLEPGQSVVTDGAAWLSDGRAVRVVGDPG